MKALSAEERARTLSSRVQDTVIEESGDIADATHSTLGELASAATKRAAEFELKVFISYCNCESSF